MAQGSQLASLLPTDVRHWWPIIEDVFTSPAVAALKVNLLTTFRDLREFQVISIDATVKCCMGVLGQLSYRAPKAKRDAAPFDDDHAFRRVLTARGRTGAVLGMCAMASEKAEDVSAEMLPADGLGQVQFLSSDCASTKLYAELKCMMPNLQCLALDPIHLCIVYEQLVSTRVS